MDLDSTQALLSSNLPVGGDPNSVKKNKSVKKSSDEEEPSDTKPVAFVDSEEDEIFFGEKTDKELFGKNSKFTRRETLHLGRSVGKRSIDVLPRKVDVKMWTQYRSNQNESIDEESVQSIREEAEENEENVDPNEDDPEKNVADVAPLEEVKISETVKVVPSPRKINMLKLEPCDRHDRSRSPIKTPPRRILGEVEDDVDTSRENSILDVVNNDQIFDDSIFTEYDDRNLSVMSSKLAKKWRKKWEKEDSKTFTAETIDRLVAKQENLLKEELEDSVHEEEPHDASTCSQWFNTTRDEMILFEKFGEDYDEVVNKMSHEEKLKLKQEVEQSVPKEADEILAIHEQTKTEEVVESPVPKPRTQTPVKQTPIKVDRSVIPNALAFSASKSAIARQPKFFKSPRSLQNTPNYLRPTTASKMRMSPRKRDVLLSPGYGKVNNEPDVTPCPRAGFFTPISTDGAGKHKALKKTVMASNLDKIISPVGQYIRSNPVPPIIRQIRPKATKHFDDDLAAFERDEELCKTPQSEEKKRMFKPLPRVEYKSAKVALEQAMPSPQDDFKALPKVFGIAPTVEAKIIRHVGRERVPKNAGFLSENSPMGGVTIRRPNPARESVLPTDLDDTNTMEMSIRQVVEIKKMTSLPRTKQS